MRRSLVEPIPEIFSAALRLDEAVDAHFAGDVLRAASLICAANDAAVWKYTDTAWGAGAKHRYGFVTVPEAPTHLGLADRPTPRMPTRQTRAAAIARDGHHCRFCGIPVIDADLRRLMKIAYPDAVSWGTTNSSQHAAFQCMWLQFDHILPNSRGGTSELSNIVVACAPCNFGRMQTTLEEAQLADPLREPVSARWSGFAAWDGLERFRG